MPQLPIFSIIGGQVRTDMKCSACDLANERRLRTNRMDGLGSLTPTYMIVGTSPGMEDDVMGRPMTGPTGRLQLELLRDAGIDVTQVYVTNCLKCCRFDANIKESHWKGCKDYLIAEIKRLNPTVIISVGAKTMFWLTGYSGVSKMRKTSLPCSIPGIEKVVFPMKQAASLFHVESNYDYESVRRELVEDLRWIRSQVEAGNTVPSVDTVPTDYRICETEADVDALFKELEQHDDFACDLETGDIDFQPRLFPEPDTKIISIGFSFGVGIGRALPLYAKGITSLLHWDEHYLTSSIYPRLRSILQRKKVFGHNFINFDQKWIRKHLGIQSCNVSVDTMLMHYVLDEEKGTHSLERLASVYAKMAGWKDTFTLEDTTKMCQYLCKDVDATYRIRQAMENQLLPQQKWLLYELLQPLANALMDMEYRGVCVDKSSITALQAHLAKKIDVALADLRATMEVMSFELVRGHPFNPESTQQTAELYKTFLRLPVTKLTDSGAISVDASVMEANSWHPVIEAILDIRRSRKMKSTYCDGMEESIAADGKIHTSYKVHGTVTGRPASENPNLNNLPRKETAKKVLETGEEIKAIFVASPGSILIEADYSQIELRVLACLSKDPALTEIYMLGQDAHRATAAAVYRISQAQVSDSQRSMAKTINFGVVYGMDKKTLIERFQKAGSTQFEAEEFYSKHQQTFPGVWRYMDAQEAQIRRHGYQETPFGRRRRYQEIDHAAIRQAYNFPVQSSAADITHTALIRLPKVYRAKGLSANPVLTVYDSIIIDTPKNEVMETLTMTKQVMEYNSFPWITVPIVADFKVGKTWGAMKSVNFS